MTGVSTPVAAHRIDGERMVRAALREETRGAEHHGNAGAESQMRIEHFEFRHQRQAGQRPARRLPDHEILRRRPMRDDQQREDRSDRHRRCRRFAAPRDRDGRGREREQGQERERLVPVGQHQQECAEQIAGQHAPGHAVEASALGLRSVDQPGDDEGRSERKSGERMERMRGHRARHRRCRPASRAARRRRR